MPASAAVARGAAARVSALVVLGSLLAACGGDVDGARPPADGTLSGNGPLSFPPGSGEHGRTASPPTRPVATSPHSGPPTSDGGTTEPPDGMSLGEPLTLGNLEVRALRYQRAGFSGGAAGTRVDVVTVEECAVGGSTVVQHRGWRLLDAAGHTLGRAGGKMVNGNPTEDLPKTLSTGECVTTSLAVGVPAASTPAAVQDGPAGIWLLTD